MATDQAFQQASIVDSHQFFHTILRRALKWQKCFAFQQVESVANTSVFVSPVAIRFQAED
jgi:hypothetical protein